MIMEIHNAIIYHCVSCGRVVHAELEAEPPQCCGHAMVKATGETNHEDEAAGSDATGKLETGQPVIKDRQKPG